MAELRSEGETSGEARVSNQAGRQESGPRQLGVEEGQAGLEEEGGTSMSDGQNRLSRRELFLTGAAAGAGIALGGQAVGDAQVPGAAPSCAGWANPRPARCLAMTAAAACET